MDCRLEEEFLSFLEQALQQKQWAEGRPLEGASGLGDEREDQEGARSIMGQ